MAMHTCCDSAPGSPKSRVKFLCSNGGKILPRPSDGQLKYVGGETRIISVPKDISFQEVMRRLTYWMEGEMILKYQLASGDLDALVSVKSEEDVVHMLDEMEHYQVMGYPRMRTFLFPINNVACTSPTESEPWLHMANANMLPKIHSLPTIYNLNNVPQQTNYYHTYHVHSAYSETHNRRLQPGPAPPPYYYAPTDQNRGGSGCCSTCINHDNVNCAHFLERVIPRQETLP